jgi:hypothetical protein
MEIKGWMNSVNAIIFEKAVVGRAEIRGRDTDGSTEGTTKKCWGISDVPTTEERLSSAGAHLQSIDMVVVYETETPVRFGAEPLSIRLVTT